MPKKALRAGTILTSELEEIILTRLAEGEALNAICKSDDIPVSESAVRKRAVEDEDFGTRYARARSVGYDCRAERAVTEAQDMAVKDAQAARVIFDAERWYLGKMKPKVYGDKIDVTTAGEKVTMDETAVAVRAAALLKMGLDRAGSD